MVAYTTHDIRNLALVGQAGAGKTLLVEALLHAAGAIQTPGTIERGDTVCDFDPQEKKLGHSLDSSVVYFEAGSKESVKHINLIDTPGFPDFLGRALIALPAVETAAVVVNAQAGLEHMTQTMMKAAADKCRVIIVNKIDDENADPEALLTEIREAFGDECLPINLPTPDRSAVVDCFFQPDGGATAFSSVEEAHSQIIDQVVEVDEALMEVYLEQGQELQPEQLHDPFEKALREGHLIPVCFTSAQTGAGIPELLEIMVRLMPDPTEGVPPHFLKGEGDAAVPVEVEPDTDKHCIAHVFKVGNDPFRGRLGVFRVHQGTMTPNSQLYIGDARKPFKVNHLLRLQGKDQTDMTQAIPGDICAVARVEEVERDHVLHDSHDEDHHHLYPPVGPVPLFGLALVAQKHGDEQKLSEALHKLESEDPCLTVEHNSQANETVIRGLGELHLRIVLEQLAERYNVSVDTHPPSIPYRETISKKAEAQYRHKKQTGGAGQFGEVWLRVEPLERGAGFTFANEVKGGVIPGQFIPAVEKGVREALAEGLLAGHPVDDVKVTVFDGKAHSVDSKEVAFVAAGKQAFQQAAAEAKPLLLEPVVDIRITVPQDMMGDITGDLSGRRGRVQDTETRSRGRITVVGQVPLAELTDYSNRLKAMTGGVGSYDIEFAAYEPVPGNVQQEMIAAHAAAKES